MSTPVAPQPAPPANPGDRFKNFIYWAFALSIILHFGFGGLVPYKPYVQKDQEVEKVSVSKKIKVVVPTPPPPTPTPPPPTPPPRSTPPPTKSTTPPEQPKLKLNVVKTTSNKTNNTSAQNAYVAPVKGSEEGNPNGTVASAPPAPTAGPATAPPAPTPTPRPACAVPNKDAVLTRGVEPEYPEIARQQGAVGTTQVKVTLTATGGVSAATVYKSSGNAALDNAAVAAARASSYAPETENCAPIAGSYLFRADFNTN
jgi:periplasmic protein TonB